MRIPIKKLLELHIRGKIIDEKNGTSGVVYIVDNGENVHPRKIAYKSFQERFHLNEEKSKQFLEECIRWFKLRNSYLVTPFYAKVISGQPFICMACCTTDLKAVMLKHRFIREEALIIIVQLIKSLLSIERKGFSQHQDLNPPNIMLIDLCEKFPGYPKKNMLNFQVKVSDFGMVDLYNILGPSKGAIGGKFAFKAPEQYTWEERKNSQTKTTRYSGFKPDTFALGVIIYMLLTGKHPNGMPVNRALNKNTSGSIFKAWAFANPAITMEDDIFESIINDCLREEPAQRPSLDSIFAVCLSELEKIDRNAYDNILLRFDQGDKFNAYQPKIENLRTLGNIAELPGQRNDILTSLIEDQSKQKENINSPSDVVYYGRTLQKILELVRKNDDLDDYLINEFYYLIDLIRTWHKQLKVHHLFPSANENGDDVFPAISNMMDFEVAAHFTSVSFEVLIKIQGIEKVFEHIKLFNDHILMSLYYYYQASELRGEDIFQTIHFLDLAKENNKDEALFDYMKHLWISFAEALFPQCNEDQWRLLEIESEKAAESFNMLSPNSEMRL